MWGGPTPHNLVILCLCYANQTSSEVPISSSNQDTTRLGRGDHILLPLVIPAQVQGRHNTTRSTLMIEYLFRCQCRLTHRRITSGIPPFLAIVPVDRTQQGIWGWPMQSPGQLQMLILSQKPRRKQKKRAARWIRPFSLLSPARCRRIFQTDALGSTTMTPLLGGGRQLNFSHSQARGLLSDFQVSLTARGRWAWGGG